MMLTKAPRPFRTVWAYEIGGSVFKTLSEKKKKRPSPWGSLLTPLLVRCEDHLGETKLGKTVAAGGWPGAGGDVLVNSLVGMLIHTPDDSAFQHTTQSFLFF